MQKTCKQCSTGFEITDDDLAFYESVSPVFHEKKELIPPPTLCPECRLQRRIAFRNERSLHFRPCSFSNKRIIAMHTPDTAFPVYEVSEWLKDHWDPRTYGREVDFGRPFFDQLLDLRDIVPHFSLYTDPISNINSEFTNCIAFAKNCYLTTNSAYDENCYYSRGILHSKDCCDCLRVGHSELCYECMDSHNCYRCMYVQDCETCSDCSFSAGLRGCTSCIGCHNLVQKNYCAFNEQLGESEWKRLYGSMHLTRSVIGEMQKRSDTLRLATPQRFANLVQCENVTGDRTTQSKNCREVFDCSKLEDCNYCFEISDGLKDSRDCSVWGERAQLFYECQAAGTDGFHCLFCDQIWRNNRDLLYCMQCFPSTTDCFGCFSLHNHRYCILNKQYTKEEYENLVPKIINHMRSTGEWGEFFPVTLSDYAYNQTIAQEFFPLTKEQVTARGWRWYQEPDIKPATAHPLPDTITDVSDAICDTALTCAASGKQYKLIRQELVFYRSMGIPVPDICPDQRHKHRMQLRRPLKLWDRQCMQCAKAIKTTYAPDRPEIVYCEDCYLKEVY